MALVDNANNLSAAPIATPPPADPILQNPSINGPPVATAPLII